MWPVFRLINLYLWVMGVLGILVTYIRERTVANGWAEDPPPPDELPEPSVEPPTPVATPGSLDWAKQMLKKKKSAGGIIDPAYIKEIRKLQNRFSKRSEMENLEDLISIVKNPGIFIGASGAVAVPTTKQIVAISRVLSAQPASALVRHRKHAHVSVRVRKPATASGEKRLGGQEQVKSKEPAGGNLLAITPVGDAEIQLCFNSEESEENLVDSESIPSILNTASAIPEAPKQESTPPAGATITRIASEEPALEDTAPAITTSVFDAAGVSYEDPSTQNAKLDRALEGSYPGVCGGEYGLPNGLGGQKRGDWERDQSEELAGGNIFAKTTTWKQDEHEPCFAEPEESECKAESTDGESVPETPDTAGAVSGTLNPETAISPDYYRALCNVPSGPRPIGRISDFGPSDVVVSDDPKPEVAPVVFPSVATPEAPIRHAQPENSFEKTSSASKGGNGRSIKPGRPRQGDLKRHQEKKSVGGKIFFTTNPWKKNELKSHLDKIAESESGVGPVDGGSVLDVLDTCCVTPEAPKIESTPPSGSANIGGVFKVPKSVTMRPTSSTIIVSKVSDVPRKDQNARLSDTRRAKQTPRFSEGSCESITRFQEPERVERRKISALDLGIKKVLAAATRVKEPGNQQPKLTDRKPGAETVGGGSVLTVPNTIGVISEAPKPGGATYANPTCVQGFPEAPKLEIEKPTLPPITTSEVPPIHREKLENPLKKQRPSGRGYDLSRTLGGRKQGERKCDQTKSKRGKIWGATSTAMEDEIQRYLASEESEESLIDGGSTLATLNTASATPGAPGRESTPPAGAAITRVASEEPALEDAAPANTTSVFDAAGVFSDPYIRQAKLENPLRKRRPSLTLYSLYRGLDGYKRGKQKHHQGGKRSIRDFDTFHTKRAEEALLELISEESERRSADDKGAHVTPDASGTVSRTPANTLRRSSLRRKRVRVSTFAPLNRQWNAERAKKISAKSRYNGRYTARRAIEVDWRRGKRVRVRTRRILKEFSSDAILDQRFDDMDLDEDAVVLRQSVDIQLADEDVLMSDVDSDSIAVEGAVASQEESLVHLTGETDVPARQNHESAELHVSDEPHASDELHESVEPHASDELHESVEPHASDELHESVEPHASEELHESVKFYESAELFASELARYAGTAMSMSQISEEYKMPQGSEHLTARWRKNLKIKRITQRQTRFSSKFSKLESNHRRHKSTLPKKPFPNLRQKSRYSAQRVFDIHQRNREKVMTRLKRMWNGLQTITPESHGCETNGVPSSEAGKSPEAENCPSVSLNPGAPDNTIKEIPSPAAHAREENLIANNSRKVPAGLELDYDSDEGEEENRVKPEEMETNDTTSFEPRAVALPSTRMAMEMKDLSDITTSETEVPTSPSTGMETETESMSDITASELEAPTLPSAGMRMGTENVSDIRASEPEVPTSPSAGMGMETGSLNDITASEPKAPTSPSAGMGTETEKVSDIGASELEVPASPSAGMGMETKSLSDITASELKAPASLSAGMGIETGSLGDITTSKPKAPTLPRAGIDSETDEEGELGLPEPTVPTTPFGSSASIKNQLVYRVGRKDFRWKHEKKKSAIGSPSEAQPKWATGFGPGSNINGTLSSFVVPPNGPATNAWGATKSSMPPDFLDPEDDFTDIFRPIPIGSKPFIFRDHIGKGKPKPKNPIPRAPKAASAPAPRERVSICPPVGAIHKEAKWSKNIPDHFNTPCDLKIANPGMPAPGMSPVNQKPAPVEPEVQLSEFSCTGVGTKKLEQAPTTLAEQSTSERKGKRNAVVAELYPAPQENLKGLIEKGEKFQKKGAVRDIKPLRARRI